MKNIKHLFLIILLSSVQFVISQPEWNQLSDIPGDGWNHACSFVIGDSAYVATGSGTDDFFRYDIHNDSWVQLADFPGGNRNYSIGFSINGKGYISCGLEGGTANMEIWEFDATTLIWTQKTSGPAIGRIHPSFSVVGDRVYIGQGQQNGDFSDLDDWYEYNTITDSWTLKMNFATPRHHAVGATVGGKIYLGTGHHLSIMFDDWYAYDIANDTWQPKTNFTGNGRSAANAVTRAGKVYVFAGEDEFTFDRFDDFREYDPIADAWTMLETFPADGRWAPLMFVHNDTIYVGTGQDNQNTDRKDLWRYDFPLPSSATINENDIKTFTVFPNPSEGLITLNLDKINTLQIKIYSSTGKLVHTKDDNFSDLQQLTLDVPPGLYYIEVVGVEQNHIKKIIIN
jgi:N-acetylneuraminic acid mutarotase